MINIMMIVEERERGRERDRVDRVHRVYGVDGVCGVYGVDGVCGVCGVCGVHPSPLSLSESKIVLTTHTTITQNRTCIQTSTGGVG